MNNQVILSPTPSETKKSDHKSLDTARSVILGTPLPETLRLEIEYISTLAYPTSLDRSSWNEHPRMTGPHATRDKDVGSLPSLHPLPQTMVPLEIATHDQETPHGKQGLSYAANHHQGLIDNNPTRQMNTSDHSNNLTSFNFLTIHNRH